MQKIPLVLILWLFVTPIFAQNNTHYFNKIFTADSINLLTTAAKPIKGGYITAGTYATPTQKHYYVARLDTIGNTQWFRNIETGTSSQLQVIERGNEALIDTDSTFVVAYSRDTTNGLSSTYNYDIYLHKIDLAGNTIWKKVYPQPNTYETIRCLKKTTDGGFIMAGLRGYNNGLGGTGGMYLVKTDYKGDTLWTKDYTNLTDAIETSAYTITPTWWDNGYLIAGYTFEYGIGADMLITKTDSVGNIKWERRIGGNRNDDCICNVVVLTQANEYYTENKPIRILVTGCMQEENPQVFDYDLYAANLDTSGHIIWQTIYPDEGFNYNEMGNYNSFCTYPIITNNKGFVGMVGGGYPTASDKSIFVKFDTNGNVKFRKRIELDTLADVYIRDMQPTADGGYVLAGFKFSPPPQQGWVVKIDSLGNTCSFVGCDTTVYTSINTAIVALPTNTNTLELYPNPANSEVTITLSNNIAANAAITIRITDILGKTIYNGTLNSQTIPTDKYNTGIYIVQLLSNGATIDTQRLTIVR